MAAPVGSWWAFWTRQPQAQTRELPFFSVGYIWLKIIYNISVSPSACAGGAGRGQSSERDKTSQSLINAASHSIFPTPLMTWWEFTGFYPNQRLRPIQRGCQPSFPVTEVTLMFLKRSKWASLTFNTKVLTSDSQKASFPPKHLRITPLISSSQPPALFPLLLGSRHHFSPITWEPPLRLPAFSCPHPTLPSAARVGFLTRQSLQTKPGFYSGVCNSPYCLVWWKDVLPSISWSVTDWSKSQTICLNSDWFSTDLHPNSEHWIVREGFWLFLKAFFIALIFRPRNIHNYHGTTPLPYSWMFDPRKTVSLWSRTFLMLLFNSFLLYCIIIDKETKILVHNKNKIHLMIMSGSELSSVVFQNMVSG